MSESLAIELEKTPSGELRTTAGSELRARGRVTAEQPATIALMLLPGALVAFMGFNAGGYFPNAPAAAAIVLSLILLVRSLRVHEPFRPLAPAALVAIAALGLYAALTLASALWSHATSRALIEFDRACLYLLVLALFATVRVSTSEMRWLIRGLAAGVSIVCLAGLISRVAPDVWQTAPNVANERLSYPVTYWNALGLLAAIGILLTLHLTCTLSERPAVRVLAAAVLPLLAATLFFTFSRGAIAAGAVGLAVYVLAARPRGLASGALATLPATVALIVIAYHASLLDTVDPTTPAAVSQGHRVALAAGVAAVVCALLRLLIAARLDPLLRRRAGRSPERNVRARAHARARLAVGVGVVAAVALLLALGAPRTIAHDWDRFFSGVTPRGNHSDLRRRLTDPSNNGRSDLWRVALRGFSASPLHGDGAGTFQILWDRSRPAFVYTVNAHSLYLQSMAELGIPGLLLLVGLVGAVLVGLARRARGPRRSLCGALLAVGVVWALHAGVDWDWEMPVVTLPFFAAAGVALAPHGGKLGAWRLGRVARAGLAGLCLAALVLPVLLIGSQSRLTDAEKALYASNCARASSAARSSIDWLSARPQPYEILGLCDLERGLDARGVAEMREAVRRDHESWERYYMLALAQASAGIDPRPTAARALRMSPREPLTRQAVAALRGSRPAGWARQARALRVAALRSNDLSIAPS